MNSRPLLIAAHGRDDAWEPLGDAFVRIVDGRGDVVCPIGVPSGDGLFTFDSDAALAAEIERLLAGRAGPFAYAGFSLGAFYGVRVVARSPRRMPRVLLIDGGHDSWDRDTISAFRDGGGERVLFVTGQTSTLERAREVASELAAAGIATRIEHIDGAGHTYGGEVERRITHTFGWLVEGDPRWTR